MLQLILDIGNTRCKLAWFKNKQLAETEILELSDLSAYLNRKAKPAKAFICDVSGNQSSVAKILRSKQITTQLFTRNLNLPIRLNYSTPLTLGTDRIANACGAHALYPNSNLLIVDAGTCLKTDLVNSKGEFLGGNISPGYAMRFKALHQQTGELPLLTGKAHSNEPFGTSTQLAMENGVYYGMLYEIEGAIKSAEAQLKNCQIILTGGDAPLFDKALKNSIFALPELTLLGLHSILENNA